MYVQGYRRCLCRGCCAYCWVFKLWRHKLLLWLWLALFVVGRIEPLFCEVMLGDSCLFWIPWRHCFYSWSPHGSIFPSIACDLVRECAAYTNPVHKCNITENIRAHASADTFFSVNLLYSRAHLMSDYQVWRIFFLRYFSSCFFRKMSQKDIICYYWTL